MKFNVRHEHYHHADPHVVDVLNEVRLEVHSINRKVNSIMATLDEFRTIITSIDTETTRIAAKIEELVAQLEAGGLSAEEEAEVHDGLTAVADRLRQVAADPDNPVPPQE